MREVMENKERARLFHQAFFYDCPEIVGTPSNHQYLEPLFKWTTITDSEIHTVVKKLRPHKAPGLSGILNIVIMKAQYTLVPYLGPIFRYLRRWKTLKTIVIKKPGQDDYGDLNLY
ncbi:hypothetical protein J132_08242 [Termitomyces sp. J132]|nr:hypothetical protein J132_08242 [Termitomyces sp. J132]